MPEVSSTEAGQIINRSDETIRRHVYGGRLPARREGPRGTIWIEIDDLRKFAAQYQYRFNEDVAEQFSSK